MNPFCLVKRLFRRDPTGGIEYWEKRARKHGTRSVFDITQSDREREATTELQKQTLYPYLQAELRGDEQLILDFGCGPGRFTPDLAQLIGGRAIGVDPIQHLLDLAPLSKDVEYRVMPEGTITVDTASVDVAFVMGVLGEILERAVLDRTVSEIERVMKPDALLFLVENTLESGRASHYAYRRPTDYVAMFPFVALMVRGYYEVKGAPFTILTGRRK